MWTAEQIVHELTRRGDLWHAGPGLVGLRGPSSAALRAIEGAVAAIALLETDDEWRLPQALSLQTLARADYFSSFPQWLTAASHLGGDPDALEAVARATDPRSAVGEALQPPDAALPPALCYHTYAALAGRVLLAPRRMTAQGTCWRHEGGALAPLERGWAFTMREIVYLGEAHGVAGFSTRKADRAMALARGLELECELVDATDPFFAPTARGRGLLQRVKGLKRELLLPIGGGRRIAAASFNHHETFFGEAFDIRLPDGTPASSGCAAFGMERWLLAFLVAHGPDPVGWPEIPEWAATDSPRPPTRPYLQTPERT